MKLLVLCTCKSMFTIINIQSLGNLQYVFTCKLFMITWSLGMNSQLSPKNQAREVNISNNMIMSAKCVYVLFCENEYHCCSWNTTITNVLKNMRRKPRFYLNRCSHWSHTSWVCRCALSSLMFVKNELNCSYDRRFLYKKHLLRFWPNKKWIKNSIVQNFLYMNFHVSKVRVQL
jgi:hypothetical protein